MQQIISTPTHGPAKGFNNPIFLAQDNRAFLQPSARTQTGLTPLNSVFRFLPSSTYYTGMMSMGLLHYDWTDLPIRRQHKYRLILADTGQGLHPFLAAELDEKPPYQRLV